MTEKDNIWLRLIITFIILVGLLYLPPTASSQETLNIQNIIRNGSFEQGFQDEFGVAYDWGGFSNGNAVVGWSADNWDMVVTDGENAQMIEIKNAADLDRYAGIYQTVQVVPGQQYKLTIKGLIRSTEGDIEDSNYGYRLQYAIDYNGATAWELLSSDAWQELPWDEQPLTEPESGAFQIETFNTTITAKTDQLTLFIRGWKKWINDGSGIFDLDEVSLVGPASNDGIAPQAQIAAVESDSAQTVDESVENEETLLANTIPEAAEESPTEVMTPPDDTTTPDQTEAQLPVSGHGQDDSINYVLIGSLLMLLLLFTSAIATTIQWRRHSVE